MLQLDEDIVGKYFAIMEFMQKENQFYQQFITNSNDYKSYSLAISLEGEKSFPELNETDNHPPTPNNKPTPNPYTQNIRPPNEKEKAPLP